MPSLSPTECLLVVAHMHGDESLTLNTSFIEATGWKHQTLLPLNPEKELTGKAAEEAHIKSARDMYQSLHNVDNSMSQFLPLSLVGINCLMTHSLQPLQWPLVSGSRSIARLVPNSSSLSLDASSANSCQSS